MKNLTASFRTFAWIRLAACWFLLTAAWLTMPESVFAAGGDLDPVFGVGAGSGVVYATVLQPDGKVIISGSFSSYNGLPRDGLARVNPDGSLDLSFNPPAVTTDRSMGAMALQMDGRILIGGYFHTFNGIRRKGLARLNADGSLDLAFDPGAGVEFPPLIDDGSVASFTVQPDKKIIITGEFLTYGGTARHRIARLNPDGTLDASFDPGTGPTDGSFEEVARRTALLPDGKIMVVGTFDHYNGTPIRRLARLNPNGSLDLTFNPGTGIGVGGVYQIAMQSDGKMVIAGEFNTYNGTTRRDVARVNSDGSLDPSFDPGALFASGVGTELALQPDGKILVGGWHSTAGGVGTLPVIARLNHDGTLDDTFDTGVGATFDTEAGRNDRVRTISLQADGQVIIGGAFEHYKGTARNGIARLLPAPGAISFSSANYSVGEGAGQATITLTRTGGTDNRVVAKVPLADVTTSPADYLFAPGSLDTSFNPVGASGGIGANNARTTALQPDGKVILGGWYFNYGADFRESVVRLNANGMLDPTFDPGSVSGQSGIGVVLTSALQANGKLIVGGDFYSFDGVARNFVARLNSDGTLDTSFDPGNIASQPVWAVAVQADGRIIVGGDYLTPNGVNRNTIARLNADGSRDVSFEPGLVGLGAVKTILVQPDGKIIIGGEFQHDDAVSRNFIARLNSNGTLDTSFNPGTGGNSDVVGVALQADGKILIIGGFTEFNGEPHQFLARLNPNGSLDASFNPGTGPNNYPAGVALQPDGKIILTGNFSAYNGVEREGLARLNPDGSLDLAFDIGNGANTSFGPIALQPDGRILVGGSFVVINGIVRRGIARITNGDFFVAWPAGDGTDKTIQLPIVDDALPETNETLVFSLIPLIGGATLGAHPTATLTIFDNEINIAPVANDQSVTTAENTAKAITLTGSDANLDLLTFTIVSGPAHGTLSGVAPNLNYTPAAGYSGRDSFSFKVNDGLLDSMTNGTVTLTVTTTFASWQAGHFTAPDLIDPAISGDGADPDGDGLKNLLEYAFHLDPKLPSPGSLPSSTLDPIYVSIIYRRAIAATDLIFTVEQSLDFITWTVAAPTNVILADDGITQTIKAQVARSGAPSKYLRLRVSR